MAVRRAFAPALLFGLLVVGQVLHLSRGQKAESAAADAAESEGLQATTRSLTDICVSKAAQYLVANLTKCQVNGGGSPNLPVDFVFILPQADEREFDMFISLRTSIGGVTMSLKFNPDPTNPDSDMTTLYSTNVANPQEMGALTVNREELLPGVYQIHIETTSPTSRFILRVFTPSKPTRMDSADVAALKLMFRECCPRGVDSSWICTRLANGINPLRADEADLCNMPPNMCDDKGRLYRLVLRPDLMRDKKPLQCAANMLPAKALSMLTKLEFLDLSNNGLAGTVDDVAAAFASLKELDTIWLNNNTISGELTCDLITPTPVKVLRLRNNRITGTIPSCFLASGTLLTLDLSRNTLEGSIPDPVKGIPLVTLNLRNQTGEIGLSGSLPENLASADQLVNLDIVDNSIEGTIPPLPASLEVAYLDNNYLTGSFPPTANLANITFFTASNNKLTGKLPDGIFAAQFIQAIDLSNNSLTGAIDKDIPWAQIVDQLTWVDLSWNQLTGTLPQLPTTPDFQVTSLLFAGNKISGNLDAFVSTLTPPANSTDPAATPDPTNPIIRLDMSANMLTGTVPPQLTYLSTFNGFIDGWATQGIPPLVDLSDNELTGPYPMWVYSAVSSASGGVPEQSPYVDFSGNQLTCPPPGSITPLISAFQPELNLTCYDAATGDEVDVLEALKGTSGDRSKGGATLQGSQVSKGTTSTRSASASSKDSKGGLGAGAIAGIVIGAVVGACILAVLITVAVVQLRKPRKKAYQDVEEAHAGKVALPRLPQSTFVGPESNIV